MLDIKFVRENPEKVKENIKKKFQDQKLELVDKVIELDKTSRELKANGDVLRSERKKISDEIGILFRENKKEEAETAKQKVNDINAKLVKMEQEEEGLNHEIRKIMLTLPNIIDDSVPIGKNDTENVEIERFGEAIIPDYEIPYHADILEKMSGLDKESSGRTSGNGFYYLMGDAARLHSAMLTYARDYMIEHGFTYCIPPFMIRSDVVSGVMSFAEMENMMYKIEGEDLYLIGTSEHSMIGRFKDQIIKESELPINLTSYSPCFRKEVGAHGIEERGIYRVHQF